METNEKKAVNGFGVEGKNRFLTVAARNGPDGQQRARALSQRVAKGSGSTRAAGGDGLNQWRLQGVSE